MGQNHDAGAFRTPTLLKPPDSKHNSPTESGAVPLFRPYCVIRKCLGPNMTTNFLPETREGSRCYKTALGPYPMRPIFWVWMVGVLWFFCWDSVLFQLILRGDFGVQFGCTLLFCIFCAFCLMETWRNYQCSWPRFEFFDRKLILRSYGSNDTLSVLRDDVISISVGYKYCNITTNSAREKYSRPWCTVNKQKNRVPLLHVDIESLRDTCRAWIAGGVDAREDDSATSWTSRPPNLVTLVRYACLPLYAFGVVSVVFPVWTRIPIAITVSIGGLSVLIGYQLSALLWQDTPTSGEVYQVCLLTAIPSALLLL